MRILIYGAGVIGCTLAHSLHRGGNEVTLFARGNWKKVIEEKGLVIKHSGYFRTTTDKIRVIDKLEKDDEYDIIFVVMQYDQIVTILSELGENISSNIVLVGNNMNPEYCEKEILKVSEKKNIAFGFQSSGGYRTKDKVISMHKLNIAMTIGGLRERLSYDFQKLIRSVFKETPYNITFENNMESWLLSHAAHILPGCYLCYALKCDLKKASKEDARLSVQATKEAFDMLKSLGYKIYPRGEDAKYTENIKKRIRKLYFIYKTPIGRLLISNHCKNAVSEMSSLDKSFNDLRGNSKVDMFAWDQLRKSASNVLLYAK